MKQKTKKKSENSNLKSIDDVSKKFKRKSDLSTEVKNLRAVVGAQELENTKLLDQLKAKDEEINHLKTLLARAVPKSGLISPDNEEVIAELQLQRLKKAAQERELTLEEARKFEIFTKTKQNAQKKAPIDAKYSKLPENASEKKLLEMAKGKKSE